MKREGNCTYSLTLNAFLSVSQADVLNDSLLALVQVLSLGQHDAFGLCVLSDEVVGLAHTLCSRLVHKNPNTDCQFKYCGILWVELYENELFVPLAARRRSESS